MDHSILMLGPARDVADMMRGLLTPGDKQPGRFRVTGFIVLRSRLDQPRAAYETGLEYGRMG